MAELSSTERDPVGAGRRLLALLTVNGRMNLKKLCGLTKSDSTELLKLLNNIIVASLPPAGPGESSAAIIEGGEVEARFSDWMRRPTRLSMTEAVALRMALKGMITGCPAGDEDTAGTLDAKLAPLVNGVSCAPRRCMRFVDKLELIRRAMAAQRVMEIEYYGRTGDEVTVREVVPLFIDPVGSIWCLDAFCKFSYKRTFFSLARTTRMRLTERRFERRGPIRPSEVEAGRFKRPADPGNHVLVNVCFNRQRAAWAIEQFDQAQIKHLSDGRVLCTFVITDAHWAADIAGEFPEMTRIDGSKRIQSEFNDLLSHIRSLYLPDGRERPAEKRGPRAGSTAVS